MQEGSLPQFNNLPLEGAFVQDRTDSRRASAPRPVMQSVGVPTCVILGSVDVQLCRAFRILEITRWVGLKAF